MTIYLKQTNKGTKWYYQFFINGVAHRGGGFFTEDETKEAERTDRSGTVKYSRKHLQQLKRREDWRKHYHAHPERDRERHLRANYSISTEQFNILLNHQGGACAICGTAPHNKALQVDHNHRTGKIRGLLCHKCNTGLGNFKDKYKLVARAAIYLRRKTHV